MGERIDSEATWVGEPKTDTVFRFSGMSRPIGSLTLIRFIWFEGVHHVVEDFIRLRLLVVANFLPLVTGLFFINITLSFLTNDI